LELSADEKTRMLYEVREKARRDEAAKIKTAHRKGKAEGEAKERIGIAKNLLGMNLPPADIAKATGLPLEEIKKLRQ
jgi:predicted transposase/invertase (TIGR01784 family)